MSQSTTASDDAAHAGAVAYTPRRLRKYDRLVFGLYSPYLWMVPVSTLVTHYNLNISGNHLDVGVGTGFLLDRCEFPIPNPRLCLLDLNPHPLAACSERLRRYRPETVVANILEPIPYKGEPFDSIGLNYVIHCVPGTIPEKAVLLDNLSAHLVPGGTIFGATVLQQGVDPHFFARRVLARFNERRWFSNAQDSLHDLRAALNARFTDVRLWTVGCAALFSARKREASEG